MSIKGFNISGTTYKVDYPELDNLPQINGNDLVGNMSGESLGLREVAGVLYPGGTNAQIEAMLDSGVKVVFVDVPVNGLLNPRTRCQLIKRASATEHHFATTTSAACVYAICKDNNWSHTVTTYATPSQFPDAALTLPEPLGVAAIGTSLDYARANHVHAMPAAEDVGAIPDPTTKSSGQVLTYNGYSWVARTTSGGGGMTEAVKQALLDCFQHVAWIDDQGQTYYNALYNALYPPAELVSISAVFTQGDNVIYDTDTLDTLKQYLVVTAAYDDQTTQTVTDYTLSGTLAEGTSTIAVSYGGKTTTFNVTVTHAESGEIEMMPMVSAVNFSMCPLYSDNGQTALTDSGFESVTNAHPIRSTRVFEQDVNLKITYAPTSNAYQQFLFTSTLWDGKTKLGKDSIVPFYYVVPSKETFPYGWSKTTRVFNYTVKAGYAFAIVGHSASDMSYFTVEVA